MAKADLKIQFQRPDPTYFLGEDLAGSVVVTASEEVEVRGVTLCLAWVAGRGAYQDARDFPAVELPVLSTTLAPGQSLTVPFSVPVPEGPASYAGQLYSVAWYATSTADLAGGFDARGEADFTVRTDPSKPIPENSFKAEDLEEWQRQIGCIKLGCFGVFGVMFFVPVFLGTLVILYVGVSAIFGMNHVENDPTGFKTTGVGLLLAVIALGFFWVSRRALASQGGLTVVITPITAYPGDTVHCRVRVRAKRKLRIAEAKIRLVARERIVDPPAVDNATSETKLIDSCVVHDSTYELHKYPRSISSGRDGFIEYDLKIPADAVPSLSLEHCKLDWMVVAQVKPEKGSPWIIEQPITVR